MPDNVQTGTGVPVATDVVTHSGDANQNVQLMRPVLVTGTEGSKTVVDLPGDAINGLDIDVTRLPNGLLDTFGKMQSVNSINDVDVQFFRDVPANLTTVTTANGGTATQTTGLMQLAASTAVNGAIRAASLDTVMYRSGGEVFCLVTAAFLDGGAATSNQRIGLFDDNNGVFIGYANTTFGITVRNATVDTFVAQASFTTDVLSGATGSKFTRGGTPEAINLALLNVWRIRFGWLGAAPIRLEVLSPDGEWVLCHVVRQPNLSATPSIASVDLPVTAQIVKTAGAGNLRLNTACWGAGLTYDKVGITGSGTLGTAANSVVGLHTMMMGTMMVRVGTSTTGTLIFEGSVDGTNWVTHPETALVGAAGATSSTPVTAAVTPTAGNIYRLNATGWRGLRVRTATTLGATVTLHTQGEVHNSIVSLFGGIAGDTPHDAVDNGAPVKQGARAIAHGTNPTQVASADRTDLLANRHGIPFSLGGHPNIISAEYITTAAQTNDNVVAVIAAGTKIVVTQIAVMASAANTVNPSVRIGFGTASVPAQGASGADGVAKVILSHPGIAPGSGLVKGNGGGIVGIGGDDEDLRITCSVPTTGSLVVQVDYFTIES